MTQNVDADKILNRIKKMMALAGDAAATEGERDNALRMSYKLLAKHNLTMLDVDGHGHIPQELRESAKANFVVYPWARNIANQVSKLFFCNYYFIPSGSGKQATHHFVGKTSNAETAAYLAEFVVRSVLREATSLYRSAIAPEARSFAVGVCSKLRERIAAMQKNVESQEKTGTALVLLNFRESETRANELWLSQQGVVLKTGVNRSKGVGDINAYNAGRTFGASVSLSPQTRIAH